jgi:hypothetical protein
MYTGSLICVISSHLFLVAAGCNYYLECHVAGYLLFLLYLTSVYYHARPGPVLCIVDRSTCLTTITYLNVTAENSLPFFYTLLVAYLYAWATRMPVNRTQSNLFHAFAIHFIGFCGFLSKPIMFKQVQSFQSFQSFQRFLNLKE